MERFKGKENKEGSLAPCQLPLWLYIMHNIYLTLQSLPRLEYHIAVEPSNSLLDMNINRTVSIYDSFPSLCK